MAVFMSESLNHSFRQFLQSTHLFRNKSCDSLYEWVTESFIQKISLKHPFFQEWILWVFMSESLNHSFSQFIQSTHLFRNKSCDSLYEWVTESFIQKICLKHPFFQEWILWLFMSESLNHSFRQLVQNKLCWPTAISPCSPRLVAHWS